MKESPVAGSLLSSLDVGDAAPSMHPNASFDAQDPVETQCDSYIFFVALMCHVEHEGLPCGIPFFISPPMAADSVF